jgi:predicted nucleic acid-binding protein
MKDTTIELRWVIDASFTLPLFFADEYSSRIDGFFNVALQRDTEIFVPALWWFEISNSLHIGLKRNRLNYQEIINGIEVCKAFNFFHIEPVTFNEDLFNLAQQYNLSAYDAAYLDLAIRYKTALATLDKQLHSVAQKLGVPVWNI